MGGALPQLRCLEYDEGIQCTFILFVGSCQRSKGTAGFTRKYTVEITPHSSLASHS